MNRYIYKARDINGKLISDIIEAYDIKTVSLRLQSMGLYPVAINVRNSNGWNNYFSLNFERISGSDRLLFTCRLADLLRGGLILAKALELIERQTENAGLRKIVSDIRSKVQGGQTLYDSLSEYPEHFSGLYVGAVKAGESSGMLEEVLARLAEFGEKEEILKNRIKASLAYPVLMLAVGLASILFLLAFVIPKFQIMFLDLGQLLPLPTRILIFASTFMQKWWFVYIPVIALALIMILKYSGTKDGKAAIDGLRLKIPIVGQLIRKELVSRFVRMLSALLKNGVPLLDALVMVKDSVGNELFAVEISNIGRSIKEGRGLADPIRKSSFFPPIVADLIAVGEETGKLENSLLRIAETYDREVEYSLKALTSLLEPVIILFVGIMVAFVALSMFLPVFQISATIR